MEWTQREEKREIKGQRERERGKENRPNVRAIFGDEKEVASK